MLGRESKSVKQNVNKSRRTRDFPVEPIAFIRTVKATNGYELFLMDRKERIVGIIDTGAGKPYIIIGHGP